MEKTLVVIKPDAVMKKLTGEIIRRYEKAGLSIAAMKMLRVDEKLIKKHYPDSLAEQLGGKAARAGTEEAKRDVKKYGFRVLSWLRDYIMSGPIVVMIMEGENAIEKARKITGTTDPIEAEKGTIRGDLGADSILKSNREGRALRNLVHASGSADEAVQEIKLWFPELG